MPSNGIMFSPCSPCCNPDCLVHATVRGCNGPVGGQTLIFRDSTGDIVGVAVTDVSGHAAFGGPYVAGYSVEIPAGHGYATYYSGAACYSSPTYILSPAVGRVCCGGIPGENVATPPSILHLTWVCPEITGNVTLNQYTGTCEWRGQPSFPFGPLWRVVYSGNGEFVLVVNGIGAGIFTSVTSGDIAAINLVFTVPYFCGHAIGDSSISIDGIITVTT